MLRKPKYKMASNGENFTEINLQTQHKLTPGGDPNSPEIKNSNKRSSAAALPNSAASLESSVNGSSGVYEDGPQGAKRSRLYFEGNGSDTGYTSGSDSLPTPTVERSETDRNSHAIYSASPLQLTADGYSGSASVSRDDGCPSRERSTGGVEMVEGEEARRLLAGEKAKGEDGEKDAEKDDDDDDKSSEMSELSDLGGVSDDNLSGGAMSWIRRQISHGVNPRTVLRGMLSPGSSSSLDVDQMDDVSLWMLLASILSEPEPRHRLPDVSTLDHVLGLLRSCSKIVVLTGAGVSVSCGIPDFRSRDGVYARLAVDYPDLPDPHAMFDIRYFKQNPCPFFKFAKEIYPGQFRPSVSHRFIRKLEEHGRLLRNYTQNIDTLEQVAGIERVVQCHGSFANATCMVCKHHVNAEVIREDIMNQVIPHCPMCSPTDEQAILKPDIVFFGEGLPEQFHRQLDRDKEECDLLIVIGSSLKVRPVALIPSSIPAHIPQILINREPLRSLHFDVELLGDCDSIINELSHRLGDDWLSLCTTDKPANEITREELLPTNRNEADNLPANKIAGSGLEQTNDTSSENLKSVKFEDTVQEKLANNQDSCILRANGNATVGSILIKQDEATSRGVVGNEQSAVLYPTTAAAAAHYVGNEVPVSVSDEITVRVSTDVSNTADIKSSNQVTCSISDDNFNSTHAVPYVPRIESNPESNCNEAQPYLSFCSSEKKDRMELTDITGISSQGELVWKSEEGMLPVIGETVDQSEAERGIGVSKVGQSEAERGAGGSGSLSGGGEGSGPVKREGSLRGVSITACLPDRSYLYLPIRRYVFSGAELYGPHACDGVSVSSDEYNEDDDDDDASTSSSCPGGSEPELISCAQEGTNENSPRPTATDAVISGKPVDYRLCSSAADYAIVSNEPVPKGMCGDMSADEKQISSSPYSGSV